MTTNLTTLRGTPVYGAGKFGNALSGGVIGNAASTAWDSAVATVECWINTTNASGVKVAVGNQSGFWLGMNAGKMAYTGIGVPTQNTTTAVNDGAWHHLAVTVDGTNWKAWVDGALVSTYASTAGLVMGGGTNAIGGFGASTMYDWAGSIDEVRISKSVRYATAFTAPAAAFTVDANTTDLYHLTSDGTSGDPAADTTPPTAPTNLTATPASTSVALAWTASTDAVGVAGYEYSLDGITWTATGSTGTTYTVVGLTASTAYTIQLRAYDGAGNRSTAASVSTTTTAAGDTTPPTTPTNLTATPANTSVALSWTASTDNVAVTGYEYSTNGSSYTSTGSTGTTYTVTGLTASTAYTLYIRAFDAAGNRSTAASVATTTTAAPPPVTIAPTDANLVYSPYNWDVTSVRAKTINPGAYLRFSATTSSITLTFDVSGGTGSTLKYRVDAGGWVTVALAASIPLTIPSSSWGVHSVEVVLISTNVADTRWTTQASTPSLTGITLSGGGATRPIQKRALNILFYGDSITEGYVNMGGGVSDSTVAWPYLVGGNLGAEVGVVGFAGQKWVNTTAGQLAGLTTSFNLLWQGGPARSFTPAPDAVVVNMGTNGGAVASVVTDWINQLLTLIPSTARVIILRPFSGAAAAALSAAVTAVANTRVIYVDTTGWWSTADSSDNIHPYGYASVADLAPRTATAIKAALPSGGTNPVGNVFINRGGVAVAIGSRVKT